MTPIKPIIFDATLQNQNMGSVTSKAKQKVEAKVGETMCRSMCGKITGLIDSTTKLLQLKGGGGEGTSDGRLASCAACGKPVEHGDLAAFTTDYQLYHEPCYTAMRAQ